MSVTTSHIKIVINARTRDDNTSFCGLCEVYFYDENGDAISKTGMTAAAINYYASYSPGKAINGATTTSNRWLSDAVSNATLASTPNWWSCDLNGEKTLSRIDIVCLSSWGDSGNEHGFRDAEIQTSDNGTDWTTVYETLGHETWTAQESREFWLPRPIPLTVKLDPANSTSGPDFSRDDLRVENSAEADLVLGNTTIPAGTKTYCEFQVTNRGVMRFGLANDSAGTATRIGDDANSWAYMHDGDKRHNNSQESYGAGFVTDDVVGMARDGAKVWFSVNNVWENSGDPAAGTGAMYDDITGDLYPAAAMIGGGLHFIAKFLDEELVYAPPTGFAAMEAAAAAGLSTDRLVTADYKAILIDEDQIAGRLAGEDLKGLSVAEVKTLLAYGALAALDTVDSAEIDADAVITAKILDAAVTYAKIQNVSATSRLLGRITAGAGVAEELTAANVETILGATATPTADTIAKFDASSYLNADGFQGPNSGIIRLHGFVMAADATDQITLLGTNGRGLYRIVAHGTAAAGFAFFAVAATTITVYQSAVFAIGTSGSDPGTASQLNIWASSAGKLDLKNRGGAGLSVVVEELTYE